MHVLTLTPADAPTFRLLAQAVYAPFIDPRTGVSSIQLGSSIERLDAALQLKRALDKVRRPSIEPPTLADAPTVELTMESAPWALLEEHWRTYCGMLPPVLAEEIGKVNDMLKRVEKLTPEQFGARAADQKAAPPLVA